MDDEHRTVNSFVINHKKLFNEENNQSINQMPIINTYFHDILVSNLLNYLK